MSALTASQQAAVATLQRAHPKAVVVVIGMIGLGCHFPNVWRRTNDLDLTAAVDVEELALQLSPTGRVMSLAGFDLALKHWIELPLSGGGTVRVATVAVIVVLKMTAWLDRPDERERDLDDIAQTLDEYLSSNDDRRYESPVFEQGLEYDEQPAFALGLDVAAIAGKPHRTVVEKFLAAVNADTVPGRQMARFVRAPEDDRVDRLSRWFTAFRRGLDHRVEG